MLDSFVQVAGSNHPVYEVFVVKLSPHESNLILHSGNRSLTAEENDDKDQFPANKTQAKGVTFYVYSGRSVSWEPPYAMWVVTDSMGIYKVVSQDNVYPFIGIPMPMINFKAPKILPPTNNDE